MRDEAERSLGGMEQVSGGGGNLKGGRKNRRGVRGGQGRKQVWGKENGRGEEITREG